MIALILYDLDGTTRWVLDEKLGEGGCGDGGDPQGGGDVAQLAAAYRALFVAAGGNSNRRIAEHLSISEETVKAHMNQIFTKLIVRNRAEAIRAAHRLGMVP